MKVTEHIHAVKIPFRVPIRPGAEDVRVVHTYFIMADRIFLVDAGVAFSSGPIFEAVRKEGGTSDQISTLILTHSHPDHIGGAKAIKEATRCTIAAHSGEME
jgi:glyoxylase-like metal-dependent hydrolase (beta-lactamase superfamily II)